MPPKPQHLSGNIPDSDSDTDSFHSLDQDDLRPPPSEPKLPTTNPTTEPERFSAEEEASLLAESNSLKGSGNTLFGSGSYDNAIQTYNRALSSCPNYLDFELAVLRSNIAACHLRLEEWKEAVDSAEKGIECLERLEPLPKPPPPSPANQNGTTQEQKPDQIQDVDDDLEIRIERLQKSGKTLDEVRKLQIKVLTRRAKAKTELGGWASLQGADEDYKTLLSPSMLPCLSPTDRRTVTENARKLAPRLNDAKDREMGEMMDKLKGLGNTILSPFGLSTENFQFVKDEKSGGYSMNFNQNAGKK